MVAVVGSLRSGVRDKFANLAAEYGWLLISDLDEERSAQNAIRHFSFGGKYYMTNADSQKPHVIAINSVKLRQAYSFENGGSGDGFFGPSSVLFAGLICKSGFDRSPRKCESGWRSVELPGTWPEFNESELAPISHLPAVVITRECESRFHFCRTDTGLLDRCPVFQDFRSEVFLRYLDLFIRFHTKYLPKGYVAREECDKFETALDGVLDKAGEKGIIRGSRVSVDKDAQKRRQNMVDVLIDLVLPDGRRITRGYPLRPNAS